MEAVSDIGRGYEYLANHPWQKRESCDFSRNQFETKPKLNRMQSILQLSGAVDGSLIYRNSRDLFVIFCNLTAYRFKGNRLGAKYSRKVVDVNCCFNSLHLERFILPKYSIFYVELEQKSDREGHEHFTECLRKLDRAGLLLEEQSRFIFIASCDLSTDYIHCGGQGLLLALQFAYPLRE